MDLWKLNFTGSLNTSIQIGDTVYSAGTSSSVAGEVFGTTDSAADAASVYQSNIKLIGIIQSITSNDDDDDNFWYEITVEPNANALPPASGQYILFGKNHEVNTSSMKGYYNSIKFENNSKQKAELFAATCGIDVSSK